MSGDAREDGIGDDHRVGKALQGEAEHEEQRVGALIQSVHGAQRLVGPVRLSRQRAVVESTIVHLHRGGSSSYFGTVRSLLGRVSS